MNFVYYLHDVSSLKEAEDTLLFFQKHYKIVSSDKIDDFLVEKDKSDSHVVLTIDDGWKSTYDYFFPVCKKYKIPITIFVSPQVAQKEENLWFYKMRFCNISQVQNHLINNHVFTDEIRKYPLELVLKEMQIDEVYNLLDAQLKEQPSRGFCNVEELREMHQSGLVTIGAHTLTHPILASESVERSNYEIAESIRQLSDILQNDVTTFAYPNGLYGIDFGEREMEVCKQNGIKFAFSVDPGVLSKRVNTMAIPRCGSINRLKLGRLGMMLPSFYNQAGKRKKIREMKW